MSDYPPSDVSAADGAALPGAWLIVLRGYALAIVLGNLVWELAQLPLYTIWDEGDAGRILFAAVHCTGGDVVIAGAALLASLLVLGDQRWPYRSYRAVATAAVLGGVGYTVYSEWLNTEVRGSWAYTEWMPQLPVVGTGLSPLTQWLVVPPFAFWWARRRVLTRAQRMETRPSR
jgi:hypothetical protein